MTTINEQKLEVIANLWRAGRKLRGLSQVEVSKSLGVSQSAISKYENGFLEPRAWDWLNFCKLVQIDAHRTLDCGYVDMCQIFQHDLFSKSRFDNGGITKSGYPRIKVRELVPLKALIIERQGKQKWFALLKTLKIDYSVFFVYDYQLSLEVLYKLISYIQKEIAKSESVYMLVSRYALNFDLHGLLKEEYSKVRHNFLALTKLYAEKQKSYYSEAFSFDIFDKKGEIQLTLQRKAFNTAYKSQIKQYASYKVFTLNQMMNSNKRSDKVKLGDFSILNPVVSVNLAG